MHVQLVGALHQAACMSEHFATVPCLLSFHDIREGRNNTALARG
ncbi:hypothetical protein GPN2_20002 [Streptomyces murinus]